MVKKDKAASKADKRNTAAADNERSHKPQSKQHGKHGKHNKPAAYTDFATQLASLRLRLQPIEGDGNCLFRSVADQVEGAESHHAHYRQLACTHIAQHADLYAPFIDGALEGGKVAAGLKAYVARMGRTGEWGGNLELVALARALRRDVVVHQLGAPRLVIDGEADVSGGGSGGGALHVAYHDAEHYSSVRRADDHSVHTEPLPITLPASNGHIAQQPSPAAPTSDERRVMAGTGIDDVAKVRAALRDVAGDVDSAVEVLNAEQEALWQQQQQPAAEAAAVQCEQKQQTSAVADSGETERNASEGSDEAAEAEEAKEAAAVKQAASKAKLSSKELRKALKAGREEKKVQRALERKLDRLKEKAQAASEGAKESGAASAVGGTDSVVQDFGSLLI